MTHLITVLSSKFGAWVIICLILAVSLRKRPLVLVITSLALWFAVPAVAGDVITGVKTGSASIRPATILIILSVIFVSIEYPKAAARELTNNLWAYVGLLLVISDAVLATRYGSVHGGMVLMYDQILAPVLLFFIVSVTVRLTPSALLTLRTVIVVAASFEALFAIAQYATGSILLYNTEFLRNYWYNPNKISRWMGTLDQPLTLSLLMCVAVPLLAGYRRAMVQLPLLGLMVVAIIITQSRTGTVIVAAEVVFVILASRLSGTVKFASTAVLVAGGIYLASSSLSTGLTDRLANDNGSAAARSLARQYFLDHLSHFVVAGGGLGYSYVFGSGGGLHTSLESSILMYAVDIGIVFTLVYFGTQLLIVLNGVTPTAPRGLFVAGLVVLIVPQTFSALSTESAAGPLVWLVVAMANGARINYDAERATGDPSDSPQPEQSGPEPVTSPSGRVPATVATGSRHRLQRDPVGSR